MNEIKPFDEPIYITRPILPDLEDVNKKIKEIWESKWLTNMGEQHKSLEKELIKYLDVENLSLFCNGTLALQLAIQALKLSGEVITTPFTFPATVNALYQNNLKPIFCDIKLNDYNIATESIEDLITPETSAILPVHVFGNPCNIEKIDSIAKDNDLKVIYDAAHCFGVKYKEVGIGNFGDISMFSFHATKIFHTIEGGALTYNDKGLIEELDLLKNFGIKNEFEVILPGTNAKMNELQAAIGLLNLKDTNKEIKKRKNLFRIYQKNLDSLDGIHMMVIKKEVEYNYQYFPILIESEFGCDRNSLYNRLKDYNVFARKYFFPLCTEYQFIMKQDKFQLLNAKKISNQILCLPLYGDLKEEEVEKICEIIKIINRN